MGTQEKMEILAGAIRSRARELGQVPAELTDRAINELGDAQYAEQPRSVAGAFYGDESACTEWHWRRVRGMVRRGH
jgi:hypothetical protein